MTVLRGTARIAAGLALAALSGCLSLDEVATRTGTALAGRSRAALLACAGAPVQDRTGADGSETLVYASRTRITLPDPSLPPDWQPFEPGNPHFYPDEGRISADFPCTARVVLRAGHIAEITFAPGSAPRQCRGMFQPCIDHG